MQAADILFASMAALGIFSYQKLPIDAVPDITNVQVQINTAAPGYSPLETEQRVTYPIETVMPGKEAIVFTVDFPPGSVDPVHRHDAHGSCCAST